MLVVGGCFGKRRGVGRVYLVLPVCVFFFLSFVFFSALHNKALSLALFLSSVFTLLPLLMMIYTCVPCATNIFNETIFPHVSCFFRSILFLAKTFFSLLFFVIIRGPFGCRSYLRFHYHFFLHSLFRRPVAAAATERRRKRSGGFLLFLALLDDDGYFFTSAFMPHDEPPFPSSIYCVLTFSLLLCCI